MSECHGCGQPTRSKADTLCQTCWPLVPDESKARYLSIWRAAITGTPSVSTRHTPTMQHAAGELAMSRTPIGTGITLAELERQHITAVLRKCGGHQGKAAVMLGITYKRLYRKLREYGFPARPRATPMKSLKAVAVLLFASSLHAQTPVARVVVTVPATLDDTNSHADLRIGQQAQFTAKAYSASGRPLTGRTVQWSTSMGSVASVVSGRVQGRGAGIAVIRATIGNATGYAFACVMPNGVSRVPLRVRVANVAHDTAKRLTKLLLRASIDTLGTSSEATPDTWGPCVHWASNAGPEAGTIPTGVRIGHDGLLSLPASVLHVYPSASVGLTPQASVKTFVARDTVRVPAIAVSAWRKP